MIASLAEFLLAAVRIERERLRARGSWNLAGRGRCLSCGPAISFRTNLAPVMLACLARFDSLAPDHVSLSFGQS